MHGCRSSLLWLALSFFGCAEDDASPDVPMATLSLGDASLRGDASVSFMLKDKESRLVNGVLRFGTSSPPATLATAAASSPSLLGLESSADGVPHTFIWDTVTDFGYVTASAVYLTIEVSSGPVIGVPDTVGPFAIDNTGLEQLFDVGGNVRRTPALLGSPTADLAGKLYVGIFDNSAACPPLCTSVDLLDLGTQDFTNAQIAVPYAFANIAAGTYKLIAFLDIDEGPIGNACPVDQGDLVNANDMLLELHADSLSHDLTINYGNPQACP
jgi:hypothetical protein